MSNVIETQRLTKYYGDRAAVNSLDLVVPEGCVYGFLGRNGSGKSTTIKMLMGMVQPDCGQMTLLGENAAALPAQTRSRIAYIAEGHPLYTWMTIDEAVRFTSSFYRHWNRELLDQILDHFQLSRRQKIRKLSNGQRAQVSLALAVAPDPELLVLDDPTLGLDTVVRRDFLESMIQIIQRRGRSILFSSHILSDVERVADRVGVIVDGVLRVDCPIEHFRASVRKVLLQFVGPNPDLPPIEGLVSHRHVGSQLELVIANYADHHREELEALEPASIEVIELNLEDAFIEYTRGPKRSLPAFADNEPSSSSLGDKGAA